MLTIEVDQMQALETAAKLAFCVLLGPDRLVE